MEDEGLLVFAGSVARPRTKKGPDDSSTEPVEDSEWEVVKSKRATKQSKKTTVKGSGEGDKEKLLDKKRLEVDTRYSTRRSGLREARQVDYTSEVKHQPNWKELPESQEISKVESLLNQQLEAMRKVGYGTIEVRKSLIPGDSGLGLFAKKKIKDKSVICSYEGVEISAEILALGYGSRDYVASAIKDHKDKANTVVYIDGEAELSCYGRFAQDPIDEHLVNAKILWRKGKMVVVSTCAIRPGDEIYIEYGLDYWRDRLHVLEPELRARIEGKYTGRAVRFESECTMSEYHLDSTPKGKEGLMIRSEGVPLQRTPDNLLTRSERTQPEDEIDEENVPETVLDESVQDDLSFENVEECEDLADELQFLNGRKFIDDGRLYEVYQVRFDEGSGHIIGWRRPLSGTFHREDGVPYAVYGKE